MAPQRSRYLLALIVVLAIDISFCNQFQGKKLSRLNRCGGKTSSALSSQTVKARSAIHCSSHCLRNGDQCTSVIYDKKSKLCHINSERNASVYCSNSEETAGVLLEKESDCQHMGNPDADGNCICVNGYVGAYCERLMTDCSDGYNSGVYTAEMVYDVQPTSAQAPFKVYCSYKKNKARTYVLKRMFDPTSNFNRTWAEYRDGFGSVDGDHWLGLEKLHHLTAGNRNFKLFFEVRPKYQTNHYNVYRTFVLANESNSYKFSFKRFLSTTSVLDDCLTDLQGAKFSTYDADNDDNPSINCASKHGGGWWFKGPDCSVCNPMGPMLPPLNTSTDYYCGFRKFVPGEAFWGGLGELYPYYLMAYLVEI